MTEPLDLESIKARLNERPPTAYLGFREFTDAVALIAEVERLRAEKELRWRPGRGETREEIQKLIAEGKYPY